MARVQHERCSMKYLKIPLICLVTILITSLFWWSAKPKRTIIDVPANTIANALSSGSSSDGTADEDRSGMDVELVQMDVAANNTNGSTFKDHSLSYRKAKSLPSTVINQYITGNSEDRHPLVPTDDVGNDHRREVGKAVESITATDSVAEQASTPAPVAPQAQTPPPISAQPEYKVLGCDSQGEKIMVQIGHPGWFWYRGAWRQHCPQIMPQNQAQPANIRNVVVWEKQPRAVRVIVPPAPQYYQQYYQPVVVGGWGNQNCGASYRQGYVACAPSVNYSYNGCVSFGYGGSGRGTYSRR